MTQNCRAGQCVVLLVSRKPTVDNYILCRTIYLLRHNILFQIKLNKALFKNLLISFLCLSVLMYDLLCKLDHLYKNIYLQLPRTFSKKFEAQNSLICILIF